MIVLEYCIARIMKRKKSVQKTDLAKILANEGKCGIKEINVEEVNAALEKLVVKDVVVIERTRGIVKYLE